MHVINIYKSLISFFWKINSKGLMLLLLVALIESLFSVLTIVGVAPFADYLTDPKLVEVNDITAFLISELKRLEIVPSLLIFGVIFISLNIIRALLEISVKFVSLRIKYLLIKTINTELSTNMLQAQWPYIKALSQGKIINTLTRETGILGDCAGIICLQMTYVTKFVILLILPCFLFPHFILTFLAISFLLFLPYLFIQKVNYRLGQLTTETSNSALEKLSELIRSIKALKAYQAEKIAVHKYGEILGLHFNAAIKSHTLNHAILSGYQTLGVIALVITTLIFSNMLISEMAVVIWTMVQSLPLIGRMLSSNTALINFFPSFEQVEHINNEARKNLEPESESKSEIKHINSIELTKIGYSISGTVLIREASLSFKKGHITALCGYSGSGKSTLAEIVFGFIMPSKGKVLVNGIDMNKLSHRSFRKRIAYCSQESLVLTGSIYDNLSFVKPDLSKRAATEALKFAEAHTLLTKNPDGLNAQTGVFGNNLSGGERQKISLAQAYIKDPDVFLFDETTASIDTVSEQKILNKIRQLSSEKIVIMITHNINSLKYADNIFLIDGGKVIAEGDYASLERSNSQFKQFVESASLDNEDHAFD